MPQNFLHGLTCYVTLDVKVILLFLLSSSFFHVASDHLTYPCSTMKSWAEEHSRLCMF